MRLIGCVMLLFVAMVYTGCETMEGGGAPSSPAASTGSVDSGSPSGMLTAEDYKRMGIAEMEDLRK